MHVSNMADQHFAQQQLHDVNKKAAKAALELQIHKRLVTETRLRDNYNITKKYDGHRRVQGAV